MKKRLDGLLCFIIYLKLYLFKVKLMVYDVRLIVMSLENIQTVIVECLWVICCSFISVFNVIYCGPLSSVRRGPLTWTIYMHSCDSFSIRLVVSLYII